MGSKYEQFMDEGTNKLMEVLASPSLDEEEKTAIVAAFSEELSKHISDHEEMPDYDFIICSISLNYVDRKLSAILAKVNLSAREFDEALALCSRHKVLVRRFRDNSWLIPNLVYKDVTGCEERLRSQMEQDQLSNHLTRLDRQIDAAMARAEKEISVVSCNEVIVLLDELSRVLDSCSKKKIPLPALKNGDTEKLYKKVASLQANATQKEALYREISDVDSKLLAIVSMMDSTPIQWQKAISLCHTLKGYIAECKKKAWVVPSIHSGEPDSILTKYTHYHSMLALDQSISGCSDYLSSKKQFTFFQDNCSRQVSNIAICQKNNWPIPELSNANPTALLQSAVQAKTKMEKARKLKLKLIAIAAGIIAVLILVIVGVIKSREGKIAVPLSSSYAVGCNCDDLRDELEAAGFTNIKIIEDDSGWTKSNEVVSISVDNESSFNKDGYYEPDVAVVITCSSKGRIDIAEYLKDWQTRPYTEVVNGLKAVGFTNITTSPKNTFEKNEDQLTAKLVLNDKVYTNGHCYLPEDAPIDITYFTLKITMSNDNASFIGQNYVNVVNSLAEDGFTNVQTEKINTGWAKGNSVIAVTINNQTTYDANNVYSPGVKIVVKYSSDDRINATTLLNGWDGKNYSDLQRTLCAAGLTNITATATETESKSKNQLVASISLNGQSFTGGDCFIQKNAPIQIKYYKLMIDIEDGVKDYEGRDYQEVVSELASLGFANITLKRANDLVTGWLTKEGSIQSIRINGVSGFEKGESFAFDDEIVIVVHTFTNKGCEDITIIDK